MKLYSTTVVKLLICYIQPVVLTLENVALIDVKSMVMTKVIIIHQNCRLYSVLYCWLYQSIFLTISISESKKKNQGQNANFWKICDLAKMDRGCSKVTKSYRLRLKGSWFYNCEISCFFIKNLNYSRFFWIAIIESCQ